MLSVFPFRLPNNRPAHRLPPAALPLAVDLAGGAAARRRRRHRAKSRDAQDSPDYTIAATKRSAGHLLPLRSSRRPTPSSLKSSNPPNVVSPSPPWPARPSSVPALYCFSPHRATSMALACSPEKTPKKPEKLQETVPRAPPLPPKQSRRPSSSMAGHTFKPLNRSTAQVSSGRRSFSRAALPVPCRKPSRVPPMAAIVFLPSSSSSPHNTVSPKLYGRRRLLPILSCAMLADRLDSTLPKLLHGHTQVLHSNHANAGFLYHCPCSSAVIFVNEAKLDFFSPGPSQLLSHPIAIT